MKESGQRLILGLRSPEMDWLRRTGALEVLGSNNVFPTQKGWFAAMNESIRSASEDVGKHKCDACPIQQYLEEGPHEPRLNTYRNHRHQHRFVWPTCRPKTFDPRRLFHSGAIGSLLICFR